MNMQSSFSALTVALLLCLLSTGGTAQVVVNECFTGVPDWCEVMNLSGSSVNIGGWSLIMADDPTVTEVFTFPSGTTLAPYGIAVVSESVSGPLVSVGVQLFTTTGNINWAGATSANDPDGAAGLNDGSGAGMDLVLFGSPTNLPTQSPASSFSGSLPTGSVFARNSMTDTDSSADWAVATSGSGTPGAPNPGQTVPPLVPDTGQANQASASMYINGGVNLNGHTAAVGENGPFFANGSQLSITVDGNPNQPFLLLLGALNRTNAVFPFGNLDIGYMGASLNFSDVQVVMNGVNGTGFFDLFARTDPSGVAVVTLGLPGVTPGVLGTFQAIVYTGTSSVIELTAAFVFTVQ